MSNDFPPATNAPGAYPPAGAPYPPQGSAPKKRRTGLIAAVAVAGLVAVGGVGTAVGMKMLGGGGSQPDEVLPKSTLMYVRVDLDPSAGQKISAYRLLDKFPKAKDVVTAKDPKKALFEEMKKNDRKGSLNDVDYDRDIAPWLGDRFAVGILPPESGGKDPVPVFAVQVKDQAKAEESYNKIKDKARNASTDLSSMGAGDLSKAFTPGGMASVGSTRQLSEDVHWYKGDYLIITDKKFEQSVRSAVDAGPLRDNADYAGDMKALGDQGISSLWVDGPKVLDAMPQDPQMQNLMRDLREYQGRSASTVRFSSDAIELASVDRGAAKRLTPGDAAKDVGSLPGDTAALITVTGGEQMVKTLWPMLQDTMTAANRGRDPFEGLEQTGLKMPQDLETLLGKQFDLVMPQQDFRSGSVPVVSARLTTDTSKASSILGTLRALGADLPNSTCGERLCLGSTPDAASRLTGGGGTLGDNAAFKGAVADADKANAIMFVDLDRWEKLYLNQIPSDYRPAVEALRAIGVSTVRDGDVERSTMRILAN